VVLGDMEIKINALIHPTAKFVQTGITRHPMVKLLVQVVVLENIPLNQVLSIVMVVQIAGWVNFPSPSAPLKTHVWNVVSVNSVHN
jgi:hypothetical protein